MYRYTEINRDYPSMKITEFPGRSPLFCFSCNRPTSRYMVKDFVWRAAFPDYAEIKRGLLRKFPGDSTPARQMRAIELCFDCLTAALERPLTEDDFDLSIPLNHGIKLGLEMARPLEQRAHVYFLVWGSTDEESWQLQAVFSDRQMAYAHGKRAYRAHSVRIEEREHPTQPGQSYTATGGHGTRDVRWVPTGVDDE